MSSKKVLGIDLGTTNSCVAVIDGGAPKVLENLEGKRTTPSVVAFSSAGQTFIGDAAKRQAHANTLRTIYSAKRIIGKKFDDIQHIIDKLPYKIIKGPNGEALISIDSKTHSPSYISGLLLSHLVKDACQHLGMQIKDVVITVPAHFNDAQRQATKDAGEIAGLNVLRIINEPTAAAMAYGMDKITSGKILVFDLGGGTFDVTLLDIMDGLFRVITTDGDTELGGEDFDNAIMSHVLADFKKKEGIDLSKDGVALYRIKEASEEAKKELSRQTQTTVSVPFIAPGPKNINCVITRPFFESLINSYVDRAISLTSKMLSASNINIEEIDKIVCVGGSTRIPLVRERLQKFAGKNISFDINPDEAVALGASIQGGILVGEVSDVVLLDVTPLSLGIESMGGAFAKIIEKNTQIPTSKSKIFTTTMDNQSSAQIVIYQGERPMVRDNKKLGEFELVGIKQTQRGEPQIEVTFHVDANGIMKVSAKDLSNNSEQKIVLHPDTGLSKDEIAKMIKDAEEQKQKDEEEVKKVEINNQLELNIYSIEKLLADNKEKLPESEFSEFESSFSELKVMQDKEIALEQSKTLLQNIQSKIPSDQPKTE